jgi:hypothetical protein
VPQPLLKYKLHLKFTGENKTVNMTLSDVPRKPDGGMYSKCIVNMEKLNVSNIIVESAFSKTFILSCNLQNEQSFDNSTASKKSNIIHTNALGLEVGTFQEVFSPLTRGEFAFLTTVPYSSNISFRVSDDTGAPIAPFDLSTTRYDLFLNLELIE